MASGTRLGQLENTFLLSLLQQRYARFEKTPRLPCLDTILHTLSQDVRKHPERHQRQQNQGAFHQKIAVLPHLGEERTAVIHASCTVSLRKNSAFALWAHPSQWVFLMPHCLRTPECRFQFPKLARTANKRQWFSSIEIGTTAERPTHAAKNQKGFTPALLRSASGELLPS